MNEICFLFAALATCAALGLECANATEAWHFYRDKGRDIKRRLLN